MPRKVLWVTFTALPVERLPMLQAVLMRSVRSSSGVCCPMALIPALVASLLLIAVLALPRLWPLLQHKTKAERQSGAGLTTRQEACALVSRSLAYKAERMRQTLSATRWALLPPI